MVSLSNHEGGRAAGQNHAAFAPHALLRLAAARRLRQNDSAANLRALPKSRRPLTKPDHRSQIMTYRAHSARYDAMEYRNSGRSGLKLPVISLGLWQNFGGTRDYPSA